MITKDQEDGLHTHYHSNGKKWSEVNWLNGKPEGMHTSWHMNGQISSKSFFKNGKSEGMHTFWNELGQMVSKGNYLNDKEEGTWTYWYDNGKKTCEGNYLNGKEEGKWIFWDESGQVENEVNFKNGEGDVDGYSDVEHDKLIEEALSKMKQLSKSEGSDTKLETDKWAIRSRIDKQKLLRVAQVTWVLFVVLTTNYSDFPVGVYLFDGRDETSGFGMLLLIALPFVTDLISWIKKSKKNRY